MSIVPLVACQALAVDGIQPDMLRKIIAFFHELMFAHVCIYGIKTCRSDHPCPGCYADKQW